MTSRRADVIVLGAGLQGAGIALELARRGIAVTLIDQDERAMNRASLRNEGKIHLGFIYANDRSFATAALQIDGALRFRGIVAGWLGRLDWLIRSTTFHYLVAADSIVAPDALAAHYAAVEARCREAFAGESALDYLGDRPVSLVRALTRGEIAAHFDRARFQAGFATGELAIDTEQLAVAMRQRLASSSRVRFLPDHAVRAVAPVADGYRIEGDGPAGPWSIDGAQVVNATWEQRSALDAQLGFAAPEGLLHRLKYRVIARLPDRLRGAPSVSMVLGRYGDVVVRPDGTAYLSWYPSGLRGWSHDLAPPPDWTPACRGELKEGERREVAHAILSAIDAWYPGIGESEPLQVDAGAIVAYGHSDVDDDKSGLHDRTRVGVTSRSGWHSVDPGKLTTAPRFAVEAAERVIAHAHGRFA
jgi:glycine/D-amino acid oxidase-like deaminating enzyme